MKTVLITGAAGFIGHILAEEFVKDHKVICLVRPGSKNLERLDSIKTSIEIVSHNLTNTYAEIESIIKEVDIILHAGGNPSSEDSILQPFSVINDNVIGTAQVLELARRRSAHVVYYSAGEVFGPITPGTDSLENDPYNSVSPYAASKAAGEEICISYANTFSVPVSITHITNTFGPRLQHNRFPIIAIRKILNGEELTIHTGLDGSVGGRRWLPAIDVALQTRFMINNHNAPYEKWNSSGPEFITNLELAQMIAEILGKDLKFKFEKINRAGHDPFFSITPSKFYDRGWTPSLNMRDRLKETVEWYINNPHWLARG